MLGSIDKWMKWMHLLINVEYIYNVKYFSFYEKYYSNATSKARFIWEARQS